LKYKYFKNKLDFSNKKYGSKKEDMEVQEGHIHHRIKIKLEH